MNLKALFLILLISLASANKLSTQLQTQTRGLTLDLFSAGGKLGSSIISGIGDSIFKALLPGLIILSPAILVGFVTAKLLVILADVFITIIYSLSTVGSSERSFNSRMYDLQKAREKVKHYIETGAFYTIGAPIIILSSLPALAFYGLFYALRATLAFLIKYMNPVTLFLKLRNLLKSKTNELDNIASDANDEVFIDN